VLHKFPSEILSMTLPQAYILLNYWKESPPVHEMLALLATVFTTWKPTSTEPKTEEEVAAENLRSVQQRWASGQSMNPKQMFEAFGGKLSVAAN
jgi:hypothetical protein